MEQEKKVKKPTFKYSAFMENLESISFTEFKVKEGSETREDHASYIPRLEKIDDCYSNTFLAMFYCDGILVDQDDEKMVYYIQRAAKFRSPIAYALLALCYYAGFIVEKDQALAQKYSDRYNRSAASRCISLNDFEIYRYILKKGRELLDKDKS